MIISVENSIHLASIPVFLTTPIIPVMCGESANAKSLSQSLAQEGVMAGAITFPMVARDKARVRTQMSAGLTEMT